MSAVSDTFWVQVLKPFMLLAMLTIAMPFKMLVQRKMKDGWLKRLLLRRIGGDQSRKPGAKPPK